MRASVRAIRATRLGLESAHGSAGRGKLSLKEGTMVARFNSTILCVFLFLTVAVCYAQGDPDQTFVIPGGGEVDSEVYGSVERYVSTGKGAGRIVVGGAAGSELLYVLNSGEETVSVVDPYAGIQNAKHPVIIPKGEFLSEIGVNAGNTRLYVITSGGTLHVLDAVHGTDLGTVELSGTGFRIPQKSSAATGVYAVNKSVGALSLLKESVGEVPVLATGAEIQSYALDRRADAKELLFAAQEQNSTSVTIYRVSEKNYTHETSSVVLEPGMQIREITHLGLTARLVCTGSEGFSVFDVPLSNGAVPLAKVPYHGATEGTDWQFCTTPKGAMFSINVELELGTYLNVSEALNYQFFGRRYVPEHLQGSVVISSTEVLLVCSFDVGSDYFDTAVGGVLIKAPPRAGEGDEEVGGSGGHVLEDCECDGDEILPDADCMCTTSTRTFTFDGDPCECHWEVIAPLGWKGEKNGCSVTISPDGDEGGHGKIELSVKAGDGSSGCKAKKTVTACKVEFFPPSGTYQGAMGGHITITPPPELNGCGGQIQAAGDAGHLSSTAPGQYGFSVSGSVGGGQC